MFGFNVGLEVKFAVLMISTLCLAACGMRHTQHADGSKSYEVFTGLNSNTACENELGQVVHEATFGLWASASEAGLGFQSKRLACLKQECQMVIWLEDPNQIASVEALIGDLSSVCVIE